MYSSNWIPFLELKAKTTTLLLLTKLKKNQKSNESLGTSAYNTLLPLYTPYPTVFPPLSTPFIQPAPKIPSLLHPEPCLLCNLHHVQYTIGIQRKPY